MRCQRGKTPSAGRGLRRRADRVTTLRPERGYSDKNYDASAAKRPKPLRRQFGSSYAVKKVRNIYLMIGQRLELPAHLVMLGIVRAILAGERDRQKLAALCDAQILKKQPARLLKALAGTWQEAHLCALRQGLEGWEFYQRQVAPCAERLAAALAGTAAQIQIATITFRRVANAASGGATGVRAGWSWIVGM